MRSRVIWLMAVLTIGCLISGSGQAQTITNLFTNGGFETGAFTPWWSAQADGQTVTCTVVKDCTGATVAEGPIEGTYCLKVQVSGSGVNTWDGQVNPTLATGQGVFKQGKKYTLSIFFKGKVGGEQIHLKPQLNQSPWTGYGELDVTMTTKWVEYHTTTSVMTTDVTPAAITFSVLYKAQEFWIDDAKWYEGDYVPTVEKDNRAATSPVPDDKARDVPRDVTLSWPAGPVNATYNVYFAVSSLPPGIVVVGGDPAFAAVSAASRTNPQGVALEQGPVRHHVRSHRPLGLLPDLLLACGHPQGR